MKTLVTGVAGAIGSHLAEALIDLGHGVIGIDALTDYYSTDLKKLNLSKVRDKGVKVYTIDLAKDDLNEAVSGVEIVYHLAAQPGISAATHLDLYLRNNLTATHRLLEALKSESQVRLFVNCSTSSVYGHLARGDEEALPRPVSCYGVTKLAAEHLAFSYYWEDGAIPVTSARLFSVYGERERPDKLYTKLINTVVNDASFPLHEGSEHHSRSYTYVGDAVQGFLSLMRNIEAAVGNIFNIGSDVKVTTGEAIRLIEELLGKKAKIKIMPRRKGDVFETHANIDKARNVLSYSPKTAIRDGLRKQVEWYFEEIHGRINLSS